MLEKASLPDASQITNVASKKHSLNFILFMFSKMSYNIFEGQGLSPLPFT